VRVEWWIFLFEEEALFLGHPKVLSEAKFCIEKTPNHPNKKT